VVGEISTTFDKIIASIKLSCSHSYTGVNPHNSSREMIDRTEYVQDTLPRPHIYQLRTIPRQSRPQCRNRKKYKKERMGKGKFWE
jgi:hypothetical protein